MTIKFMDKSGKVQEINRLNADEYAGVLWYLKKHHYAESKLNGEVVWKRV